MDLIKRYIYVLNYDVEDEVTLEVLVVQPEAVIQPEVASPIATMMERPRRQQRQPVHLQDCEAYLDDEVDDNGDLDHFAFLVDSKPVRLADNDWGGDLDKRKSTSGNCFMIGKTVCLWSSKK